MHQNMNKTPGWQQISAVLRYGRDKIADFQSSQPSNRLGLSTLLVKNTEVIATKPCWNRCVCVPVNNYAVHEREEEQETGRKASLALTSFMFGLFFLLYLL